MKKMKKMKKIIAGDKAISLVDKSKLKFIISKLKTALADEWLAHYQYWVDSKILKGFARKAIAEEFESHANKEKEHAEKLTKRIIELGGTPILNPINIFKHASCGYIVPKLSSTLSLVRDNIKGEQCAIDYYNNLAKELKGVDSITYLLIMSILKDEIEHEEDLRMFIDDAQDSNKD
jgi:bacterioferritin